MVILDKYGVQYVPVSLGYCCLQSVQLCLAPRDNVNMHKVRKVESHAPPPQMGVQVHMLLGVFVDPLPPLYLTRS